ncbi:MAG: hypothetical protein RR190_00200 [Bacteroidales bacterium]
MGFIPPRIIHGEISSPNGGGGLQHGMTKEHLKRIRQLEKMNETLKTLLAEN